MKSHLWSAVPPGKLPVKRPVASYLSGPVPSVAKTSGLEPYLAKARASTGPAAVLDVPELERTERVEPHGCACDTNAVAEPCRQSVIDEHAERLSHARYTS